jgi:hypothetical protein
MIEALGIVSGCLAMLSWVPQQCRPSRADSPVALSLGERARRKDEPPWGRRRPVRTCVEVTVVKASASRGLLSFGGAASGDDPVHHLGEVRAIRKDCRPLDDIPAGPVGPGQARHNCTDRVVLDSTQATPSAAS